MKRATVLLMLLCMLTVTASAAYVPEEVVSENRDGRQLIIKTYTLPPDADPSELIEEPFELEGYTYDEEHNPIGEFTSDDEGYVYITTDELPDGANTSGLFYLRELEAAEGYILDEEYKTVYVRPGRTVEIEWVNEAITGQIQIYKYAAEANPVTGDPAGTPLQGAVYEIINERSGKVVDYITTDARGVAASEPLPLTRYKIREVTAPAYYQIDPTVHDVTLEYAGQITITPIMETSHFPTRRHRSFTTTRQTLAGATKCTAKAGRSARPGVAQLHLPLRWLL